MGELLGVIIFQLDPRAPPTNEEQRATTELLIDTGSSMPDRLTPTRLRLDVWLDIACLYRTRSEAQKACQMGRVEVNGQRAKPHRDVKPGDELQIQRPMGRQQRVIVRALADQHIAKPDARLLYDDVTPPPSPEELEWRRMAALARPVRPRVPAGSPDKRQRRVLRRAKEGLDPDER
jgi:ribosome-associated heat shock protein Hsp15